MSPIAIVIPVRNRQAHTQQILTQLHQQLAAQAEIIVVDDGSSDGTAALIRDRFPAVHLLEGDGSLWWTGAIAMGMRYALQAVNPDYVVWLNDDIVLAADFGDSLLRLCRAGQHSAAIVGGIVCDTTYPDWIVYGGVRQRQPVSRLQAFGDRTELAVDFLCGNLVVIPRPVIEAIGLPDAARLPHHGGDYEYVRRARQAGFAALLTSRLQASTCFELSDFVRYMPYWMQWHLQPDWAGKWRVLRGLTSRQANQNIWLMVNLHADNRDRPQIAPWRYGLCYCNKVLKLMAIACLPPARLNARICAYLDDQNPPAAVRESLRLQQARQPTPPPKLQCR